MNFAWDTLATEIAIPLLKGSVGEQHLIEIAEKALSRIGQVPQEKDMLSALGTGALQASFEGDILNSGCAQQLLHLQQVMPFLDPALMAWAKRVSVAQAPQDVAVLGKMLQQGDTQNAFRYLERAQRADPQNIFIIRHGIIVGFMVERLDWVEDWVKQAQALVAPVQKGILGDVLFAQGNWSGARQCYAAAVRDLPVLLWQERLGEAALRCGDIAQCLDAWHVVLNKRPWHTNLLLRHHDVATDKYLPGALPEGTGVILLYTYNKDACIEATLQSLMASEIAKTPVFVLNNGSTDNTAAVIRAWEDRSAGQVRAVSLPCNVGAPAARNWLLTEPEVRKSDWLVFLDDDVQLPAQWLGYLGRSMQEYPGHPVYGCRVVNHDTPMTLQSVDLHLDAGETAEDVRDRNPMQEPVFVRPFAVSGIHHQTPDFGDFTYMRPCASVTGCCHLFRREAIDAAGHFDIRFSPSQYDDLEHDIRHILRGTWPVYQGHLRIRHMKQTGRGIIKDAAQFLSSWGNLFKLQAKYTREQYAGLRQAEYTLLRDDMLRRVLDK